MKFNTSNEVGRQKAVTYFKALLGFGKIINISEAKEIRTLNQNRLYWLYMACIEQETGNDADDLHEYFKIKFLGLEAKQVLDGAVYRGKSTTKLDTKQFTDYIEKIVRFASTELSIALPDPNDKYFNDFYEQYKPFIK